MHGNNNGLQSWRVASRGLYAGRRDGSKCSVPRYNREEDTVNELPLIDVRRNRFCTEFWNWEGMPDSDHLSMTDGFPISVRPYTL